jgi:hypothetical protein
MSSAGGLSGGGSATDLTRFESVCPQLMVTETLRAGHFSPLAAPHNAMIERFLTIGIERQAHTGSCLTNNRIEDA